VQRGAQSDKRVRKQQNKQLCGCFAAMARKSRNISSFLAADAGAFARTCDLAREGLIGEADNAEE
jgi:hypothetical protein